MTHPSIRRAAALLLVSGVSLVSQRAPAAELPAAQQALLILRILSYDRNLKTRAGGEVVIGVLAEGGSCGDVRTALESVGKQRSVAGMPVRVTAIEWPKSGLPKLDQKPAALYVCSGFSGRIDAIAGLTRDRDILSIAGAEADVRSGLGVGFTMRGDKASLVVNIGAAKQEGAELDSALLSLAEIVGR